MADITDARPIEPVQIEPEHRKMLNQAFADGALVMLTITQERWTTKLTPEMIRNAYKMDITRLTQQLQASAEFADSEEGAKVRNQIGALMKRMEDVTKLPENFKLGRVFLIPEERIDKLDKIESRARTFLDKKSFEFGGKSQAKFRFVNKRMLMDVMVELRDMRQTFFAEATALLDEYEHLKGNMKEKYPDQWPILEGLYKPRELVQAKYTFITDMKAMSFPKSFDNIDMAALIRRENTDKEYRAKAEAVIVEQRQASARQARTFIEECMKTVRGKVVDVFQGLIKKIADGKDVTDANVARVRRVFTEVEQMDFLNDQAFHQQLREVRKQLDSHRTFKDNQTAVKALEAALQGTVAFVDKTTDDAAAAAAINYFQRDLNI